MALAFTRRRPGRASWPATLLCLLGRGILALRYRVRLEGAAIARGRGAPGILFLPNHPALIDPVIVIAHLHGKFGVRPLALEDQIEEPVISALANLLGVLRVPVLSELDEGSVKAVQRSIDLCIEALKQGDNVLLYPAGRLMRHRFETLGGVSAAHRIISELPDIRVVLVRTTGLWGSSFGWASGRPPRLKDGLVGHIRQVLASGLFFAPKREVQLELAEPDDLPRQAGRLELNAYLDNFYNHAAPPALYVPYSIWEKGGPRELAEPKPTAGHSINDAPAATRQIVLAHLHEVTGIDRLNDDQELARDLGLDSLAVTDTLLWLEREFAVSVPSVEAVRTVGDMIMAACGIASAESSDVQIPGPSAGWLSNPGDARVQIPEGQSIQRVFLAQGRRNPSRVIAADLQQGSRSYRDLITAILALRAKIAALPGRYVGIMLPASVAADTVFLATLFAGKIPVMINWTAGPRVVQLGLDLVGVQKILTADLLLHRLSAQGIELAELGDRLVSLERMASTIRWTEKLSAAIRARFSWRSLERVTAADTAVVLFTSGSESAPKAVPLTHLNILTNIRDALSSFNIFECDRLLGLLPPFHSFGLTATLLLPLLAGVKVVHHPNPNEVAALGKIIETYRVTILLSTPTFISNIVRGNAGSDLTSLRLCVTGAEKCSREIYESVKNSCPQAVILEGYGITECSPIVSVMREDDVQPGTIGKPLPSVKALVIDIDSHLPAPPGRTGMLLLRGPSIFGGYLNYSGPSPFETFEGATWYRTGDLVKADEQNRLTFMGRLKRFAKIGGEMISLPAIEEVLTRTYAQPDDKGPCLAVLPTPDEAHPELVLFTIRPLDRAQVNKTIQEAGLSGLHNIRIVRQIDQIPLLGTGKADYRTLAQLLTTEPP
jgi:acyl-CoA synthetase (AMP-forming)/AMP-acid ligase II/1-acyl-sn-glycerol-3-phosphate acyltransferase/acyl carrier protein